MGADAFRWQSAARSEVGNVRKLNEDACLDLSARGVWVVADGMGGHAAGDVASKMVTDNLRGVDNHEKFSDLVNDVEERVLDANRRLYSMAMLGDDNKIIGCTVVALLANGRHCVCAWAGDSRVYRLRGGKLAQITRDHSEVEELIERGEISKEAASAHAAQNIVTRAVGGAEQLFLDYTVHEIRDGDRFLICSDGLYKELADDKLVERLGNPSCVAACNELLDTALAGECADNVTAIVVDFRAAND
jgi:protein phosphatase